jgi:hypothetical protein
MAVERSLLNPGMYDQLPNAALESTLLRTTCFRVPLNAARSGIASKNPKRLHAVSANSALELMAEYPHIAGLRP